MPGWKALPDELDPDVAAFTERLRRLIDRSGLAVTAVAERTGHERSAWDAYLNGRLPAPEAPSSHSPRWPEATRRPSRRTGSSRSAPGAGGGQVTWRATSPAAGRVTRSPVGGGTRSPVGRVTRSPVRVIAPCGSGASTGPNRR